MAQIDVKFMKMSKEASKELHGNGVPKKTKKTATKKAVKKTTKKK